MIDLYIFEISSQLCITFFILDFPLIETLPCLIHEISVVLGIVIFLLLFWLSVKGLIVEILTSGFHILKV